MRGGTSAVTWIGCSLVGLSPHARGNPPPSVTELRACGPIPACAGEPLALCWKTASPWAYPRMRGGTGDPVLNAHMTEGLSPHARGNLY